MLHERLLLTGEPTAAPALATRPVVNATTIRAAQRRAAPWPYETLDIGQLREDGWRPTPIHDLVLKVYQRCNLACDYCYVYEQADQSWKHRPSAMSDEVWQAAVTRLAQHVRTHRLVHVRVILHGGEPLLFGASRLGCLAADIRAQIPGECQVEIGVQTNGVLLSPSMMQTLREHRISVGVSVDGPAIVHDRHRPRVGGRGSFAAVEAALDLLRQMENREFYAGILSVVSPDSDPLACYEQLAAFEPPSIDFLLPHANWQHPPQRRTGSATPLADWLIAVFDRWYRTRDAVPIRLFDDIISLLIGGSSRSEQVGLSPAAVLVVESDGAIEQIDALKTAYQGACATGLDIRNDDLDIALADPGDRSADRNPRPARALSELPDPSGLRRRALRPSLRAPPRLPQPVGVLRGHEGPHRAHPGAGRGACHAIDDGAIVTPTHTLDPIVFGRLAAGGGGPVAIEVLRAAQLSKHLQLIGNVLSHWPGAAAQRDELVDVMERSRQRDPAAVREVLGAPLVGAWAAIVNRAVLTGAGEPSDFGHLAALAVVAAAAAGVDADAEVTVRRGVVAVPGCGAATVPSDATSRLVAQNGRLTVHSGREVIAVGDDHPDWQSVRHLLGQNPLVRLGLDDLDPYRHGHHAPPAPRLPASEVDGWRRLFADAWALLVERLPDRATELATGLRTLVPLARGDDGSARSATLRHAFGVFGLTRPPTAADFAVTLVHEFQHSKLSAILDLVPLSDPADRRRFFAPWRVDPRPLAGLLQGVYAFVGVADTWRALREVDAIAVTAQAQFAEARLQVDRGLRAVEESGALTPGGAELAAALRRTTDTLLSEAVPAAVAAEAEQALARTRERWLARNGAS